MGGGWRPELAEPKEAIRRRYDRTGQRGFAGEAAATDGGGPGQRSGWPIGLDSLPFNLAGCLRAFVRRWLSFGEAK